MSGEITKTAMSEHQDQVAFVASTMPFQIIVKYHKLLGITRVVCTTGALKNSYEKGFSKLGLFFNIEVVSKNRWSRIFQLISHLLKVKKAIIFHECCWLELDLLIVFFNIKILYFPQVTLASRRKISVLEMPIKTRALAIFKSKWFDFYESRDDGMNAYIVPVLKHIYRPEVSILPNFEVAESWSVDKERKPNKKWRALILSGTDAVPNNILRDLYSLVASRLISSGVEVHVKDHPNPGARLNWTWDGVQWIDCDLPLECLNLSEYSACIGVASTGLVYGSANGVAAISVIHLLPAEYNEELENRLRHLNFLNIYPLLPLSVDELVSQVALE